jgi:hypothetical protein
VWSEIESLLLETSAAGRHAAFLVMNAITEYHADVSSSLRWEFVNVLRNHQMDYKDMQQSMSVLINDGASIDPLGPAVVPVLVRWMQESGTPFHCRPAGRTRCTCERMYQRCCCECVFICTGKWLVLRSRRAVSLHRTRCHVLACSPSDDVVTVLDLVQRLLKKCCNAIEASSLCALLDTTCRVIDVYLRSSNEVSTRTLVALLQWHRSLSTLSVQGAWLSHRVGSVAHGYAFACCCLVRPSRCTVCQCSTSSFGTGSYLPRR